MWPQILDLTKDECKRMLRRLELEAYYSIITAFRAQGDLTKEKKKVLQDLCNLLGISTERHRAEIRRAVNDEKLNTIADQITGCSKSCEWAIEGRRLIPLMPRLVPQTVFTAFANNAANMAAAQNAAMPPPSATNNRHENFHASNDVEMTPFKPGNKSFNLVKQNLTSHTTQTYSSPLLQSDTEHTGSSDNFPEEVENRLYSVQESQTSIAAASGNLEVISDGDKNQRRKRSASVDAPNTPQTVTIPAKSSALQRTINVPIGTSPVQVTGTVTTSGQKVILVSTSGSNLPSSILQRTLGGQVKAVSSLASASQTQSKTALVTHTSNICNATTPTSSLPLRQKGKGTTIPVTSQPSTASAHTQTLQIRPGTSLAKPTFQFKEGSGLKIIAQTMAMSSGGTGGTKMIAKPSGSGSASPIVVVTKTASLPSGIHSGTRVVNVITTQASSGKVLMPTSFSVAKSAGSPALVTVGAKGRQTALVKMTPTMSLTSQGGKPNLFVVQKAHLSSLTSGNAVPLPASVAACAQTVLRPNSESGQNDKPSQIEMKSTVLADLLQAAGILPDGASADIQTIELTEQTVSTKEGKVDQIQAQASEAPLAEKQWAVIGEKKMSEEEPLQKRQQVLPLLTQDSADELASSRSNKQSNLPLTVQDTNNLQDPSSADQAAKLAVLTTELLEQACLDQSSEISDKRQEKTKKGSSTSSCSDNVEQCQATSSSVQTVLGENGELDPTTGIFYPYPIAGQKDPTFDEANSAGASQLLQQPVAAAENVQLDFPLIKTETKQPGIIVTKENIMGDFGALQDVIKPEADEESKCSIEAFNSDYAPRLEGIETDSDKTGSVSAFLKEENSQANTINTEVENKELETTEPQKFETHSGVTSASSQSLYRGVTYSKEDAVARRKTTQIDSVKTESENVQPNDDLLELQTNSPAPTVSDQESVGPEDFEGTTDQKVIEEILECEEVHFTDDNIITNIIEETVVTTEESEHCVIMESIQPSCDPEANQLVDDENIADEKATVVHCLPPCEQEDDSVASPSTVEFQPLVFPTVQVSIKDVLASSKSQSSGSSIFMVTDSVVESDSIDLPLVVPLPDDIVAVEQIESSEESSGKIPIAEDEGDSTYGSTKIPIQIDAIKEEDDVASSSTSAGSERGAGKRKRKPSTLRTSAIEDSASAAHLSGWARSAMSLLLRVMKFRGSKRMKGGPSAAHWFLHPVTEEEAPGYHQVVKYPMDFSTVKKKLESGCYKDVSEFNQDMNLVKINCDIYNPPQNEARLDCEEVFVFYNQEYDKLIEKWQKTHWFASNQKKLKFA